MKKDKDWARKEVDRYLSYEGVNEARNALAFAKGVIDQLDEPETLSQEWIDENKVARINDVRKMTTSDVVPVEKLKKLLVPKQGKPEKVVIPQYVADWIEEKLPKSSTGTNTIEDKFYIISRLGYGNGLNTDALYQGRDYEFNNKLNRDLVEYVSNNKVKVIRALIDGYEVEKEKKYYVLDSEDIPLLERANNQTCKTTTALSIYEDGRDNSRFALTEKEIKDYDERFWSFAVKIEEVTE